MKNLIWIAAGAVVLYFVWQRYGNKPFVTKAVIIPSQSYSQNEMMNDRAEAAGNSTTDRMANKRPCWCNGRFLGLMSSGECGRKCKKTVKKGW
mgnify:CR=1 FL=1